jgi:hypothetical protein
MGELSLRLGFGSTCISVEHAVRSVVCSIDAALLLFGLESLVLDPLT